MAMAALVIRRRSTSPPISRKTQHCLGTTTGWFMLHLGSENALKRAKKRKLFNKK